ncbi:MAG: 50S ribosomal protein L23 [Patescibacteria group bacterium]
MGILKKTQTQDEVADKKADKKAEKKVVTPVKKSDKKGISKKTSEIILRPRVTEKTAQFSDKDVIVFEVSTKATKIEVKQAFKELYGVVPAHVNTINVPGKRVQFGRTAGKQKNRKKAVITLPKNTKLDIFGGI